MSAKRKPKKINSKRKGKAYEQRVARYLRDRGWTVGRAQQSDGRPDGDVSGQTPNGLQVAIECKDRAALSMRGLSRALEQAEKDQRAQLCIAVIHVPGNGKEGMDLAVMRLGAAEAMAANMVCGDYLLTPPLPSTIEEAVTRAVGKRKNPTVRFEMPGRKW